MLVKADSKKAYDCFFVFLEELFDPNEVTWGICRVADDLCGESLVLHKY